MQGYPVILIVYMAEVNLGKASISEEALEVKWLEYSEIPWSKLAFSSTSLVIKDWIKQRS